MNGLSLTLVESLETRAKALVIILGPASLLPALAHHMPLPFVSYVASAAHWAILTVPMGRRKYFAIAAPVVATTALVMVLLPSHRFLLPNTFPLFSLTTSLSMLWGAYAAREDSDFLINARKRMEREQKKR